MQILFSYFIFVTEHMGLLTLFCSVFLKNLLPGDKNSLTLNNFKRKHYHSAC